MTDIGLNGNWQHDLPVSVSGGVGEITVNLPAEMGVCVNLEIESFTVNKKTFEGLVAEREHALVVAAAIRQVLEAAQTGQPAVVLWP